MSPSETKIYVEKMLPFLCILACFHNFLVGISGMFHTFLTFISSLQQPFPAADTAGFFTNGTENAAPYGTAFSVVCVLLGEREKSHKDWLPFG